MPDYDLIVIGSGLAGLTAAVFGARHGLSTLVLESNIPGGHLISIEKIEDYPGFPDGIAGYELCPNLQRQAADQGTEFARAEVQSITRRDEFWEVLTADETCRARTVIVATGSSLKDLGVPGEAKLQGRGVSHCASCDGPLYNGQIVGVVGGGDSALQEALTLANYADRVLIFDNGKQFSGQHAFRQKISKESRITVRHQTVIEEILGEDVVTAVRCRDLASGGVSEIPLAGLFVYIGVEPNTGIVKDILSLSETGHVPTDVWMRTELPGLYAAGDIRQDSAAQAITSAADGAVAAIAAHRYLTSAAERKSA